MRLFAGRTVIVLAMTLLWGCGTSPQERFYTLESEITQSDAPTQSAAAFSVIVGPVTVPELVDRPQLVLRAAPTRVIIAEQARWGEPLKSEIPRVIAGDLARLLPNARTSTSAQRASGPADYRVMIDIQRFETALSDAVTIEVLWSVRPAIGTAQTGRTSVREAAGAGYDAAVAAHSRALSTVSRDIAAAIEADRRPKQ